MNALFPRPAQPWCTVVLLPDHTRSEVRRRAIFECCKWDPQVEDVDTLAPMAIVLRRPVWRHLAQTAELLTAETLILERELATRPELHKALAIPRRIRTALGTLPEQPLWSRDVRVMRFDFHPTAAGWCVSEVNSDVPGGYNEASGLTSIVAGHVPSGVPCGDPAERLVQAIGDRLAPPGTVALVHATSYTDDRQVVTFLGRRLERVGFRAILVAPDHLRWRQGRARIETDWFQGDVDFMFRFFPAEWLPNLGACADWNGYFARADVPSCNPGTALLSQSKRWPLVCRRIGLRLPAWEKWCPETADPREVDWREDSRWVLKPALGRVGESIGLRGVTPEREWKAIRRWVGWGARNWIAQRRFTPEPIDVNGSPWHICLGVYTVDGRAAGIYGRIAAQPLINHLARDIAVLVEPELDRRAPLQAPGFAAQDASTPLPGTAANSYSLVRGAESVNNYEPIRVV